MSSNVLFAEQWLFPYNAAMNTIVVQWSPDGRLMNNNISQCRRGLRLLFINFEDLYENLMIFHMYLKM